MAAIDLWVEKWRPDTLDGYVFKNNKIKEQIKEWIANPQGKRIPIPHLLLSGVQGTGKTTLARALCKELKLERGDIMEINASRENNVETVRDKIVNFCSTWAIGLYKVIILDEFDGFSQQAQKILRGEMERHADTVRFILTCNYPNKIIPALHSRLQGFHFDALDMDEYIGRLVEILTSENVDFDPEDLLPFVNSAYPDMRKVINMVEQHVTAGKLSPLEEASSSKDYLNEVIPLFRAGQYLEARKLLCSQARPEEYEEIFRFFYDNLDMFSQTEEGQCAAVLTIAKGLRNHGMVADPEINMAAVLVELAMIG